MLLRSVLLALSRSRHLRAVAVNWAPAKATARRFVAGETLVDAVEVAAQLATRGQSTSIDYLSEGATTSEAVTAIAEEYERALGALSGAVSDPQVSIKLTALGIDIDEARCRDHVRRIAAVCGRARGCVRIDMESSQYTERTLEIYRDASSDSPNIGIAVQAYLRRSEADVRSLLASGASVRLVKGAYMEGAAVAFPRKRDADANFVRLMQMLLSSATPSRYPRMAIATHDLRMIEATKQWVAERGVPKESFEFEMLYGIRRELQEALAKEGYAVRVYVPYGQDWYPYLLRRLAERPANVWFVMRHL